MSSNRKLSGGRGINTDLEDPFQQSGRIGSEKIVQNGLRFGLSFEEYSKILGLNQTSLKQYLHHQDRSSSSLKKKSRPKTLINMEKKKKVSFKAR